jgi:glycosyltransferase involved in cell wall biosynthesis
MKYGFSIIMPTFNRSDLLLTAIKSVNIQNYNNWEIIVIDDSSENDCRLINEKNIEQLKNNNIKYYYLEENHGHSFARNFGIEHSKKDWIVYLDDDNVMMENCLYDLNQFLNEHDNIEVVTSKYMVNYINENKHKIRGEDFMKVNIFNSGQIDTCCFFHSKKSFEKWGGWNIYFKRMADDEIIFRYVENSIKESTYMHLSKCIAQYNVNNSIKRVTNMYGNFNYLKEIRRQHDYYKGIGKCLIVVKNSKEVNSIINGDYDTASFIDSDIVTCDNVNEAMTCNDLSLKNIYVKYHEYKFFIFLKDNIDIINDLFFDFKIKKDSIIKKKNSYLFVNDKNLLRFLLKNKDFN